MLAQPARQRDPTATLAQRALRPAAAHAHLRLGAASLSRLGAPPRLAAAHRLPKSSSRSVASAGLRLAFDGCEGSLCQGSTRAYQVQQLVGERPESHSSLERAIL